MIIGITGTSGSGKTTVSNILQERLKCSLINADYIAKELAEKGNQYYDAIVEYFGVNILDNEESINRKKLADIIYKDEIKREKLNEITNTYVAQAIQKQAYELEKEGIVIIDVPRLFESGLNKICDIVVSVLADTDIKIERICKRDNIDIPRALQRLEIQPDDEFYIGNSDYIIENNDKENIQRDINIIVDEILRR